jgi:serine/threonine-protein kinase HipA
MDLTVEYAAHNGGSEPVGRLYQDPRGRVFFEYASSWRSGARELSPLYLPNRTEGAVVSPTPDFGELFGLFEDALPDWWGEQMMRRRFADLGIPWGKVTALRKLACQGERKMGALIFRPVLEEGNFNDDVWVELSGLVTAAREAMAGETAELMAQLVRSGMSPGGVRPKALLAFSPGFQEVRLDDPAPDGFESWLLKFDLDLELHEGGIEFAYAAMAREAGIDVPETHLLEAGGGRHFLSRRFDRATGGRRIHLHSFSGLTHTPLRNGMEYGELMNLARALTGDHRAVEEVFRRAVFNVIAGNDDDHGRNHAFLMDDDGTWRLAPAFDLMPATYALASGFRAGRINGKAAEIRRRDLKRLGEEQGVRRIDATIDQVIEAMKRWEVHAEEAGLPKRVVGEVRGQMPMV